LAHEASEERILDLATAIANIRDLIVGVKMPI
jgi:hypothetical protein